MEEETNKIQNENCKVQNGPRQKLKYISLARSARGRRAQRERIQASGIKTGARFEERQGPFILYKPLAHSPLYPKEMKVGAFFETPYSYTLLLQQVPSNKRLLHLITPAA